VRPLRIRPRAKQVVTYPSRAAEGPSPTTPQQPLHGTVLTLGSMEVAMHRRENPRAETPRPPLPEGLYYCRFCGEVAGRLGRRNSTCLCEGIPCRLCGIGRVQRPISDSSDPATGRWSHAPYFMGMGACRDCVITVYGAMPEGWHSARRHRSGNRWAQRAQGGPAQTRTKAAEHAVPATVPDRAAGWRRGSSLTLEASLRPTRCSARSCLS
jgi:hypothetical protein